MAPMQVLVLKSGMVDPGRLPRLWHRILVKAIGLRIHAHGSLIEKTTAAGGLQPCVVDRHHGARLSLVGRHLHRQGRPCRLAGLRFSGRAPADLVCRAGAARRAGTQAGEIAGRLAGNEAVVLFAEGRTTGVRQITSCRSRAPCSGQRAWRFRGPARPFTSNPLRLPTPSSTACRWAASIGSWPAWIGDSELVPHLFSLIGEGAIDVEVRFGAARAFTAESDRKLVARQVEQDVRRMLWAALSAARTWVESAGNRTVLRRDKGIKAARWTIWNLSRPAQSAAKRRPPQAQSGRKRCWSRPMVAR
jgi:1-acyl-sn-glycerol-3-phosphate acyltransferase